MKLTTIKIILLLLLACPAGMVTAQRIYDITAYGARGDGRTLNTTSIQKAIDAAAAAGGGTVLVPAGYFVTGQIFLRSNVEFHLADDAVILGSINRLDYNMKGIFALISAENIQNISITGKGIIDGQGRELVVHLLGLLRKGVVQDTQWKVKRPNENRPMLLAFENCTQVTVRQISLKDAAGWIQDYERCTNVLIDSIHVESTAYWNNDGIDITDSKDVRITNCFVNSADDGICLKSEAPDRSCENIYVANCTIRSSASAFKLGTGSLGGFKKIVVRDLTIYDTYRSAIALETVDGAVLEDVDIRNVTAKNTGNAILLRLGHRRKEAAPGSLSKVYIGNITVEVPQGKPDIGYPVEGPPLKYPHNTFPSSITGLPGHPVKDVVLENIEITYEGGASKAVACFSADSLSKVPEQEANYPEFSMFGELPAWGLYVRHAEGIQLKNFRIITMQEDFRQAMIFDDVKGLTLQDVTVSGSKQLPVIIMQNVIDPSSKGVKLPVDSKKAVEIRKIK